MRDFVINSSGPVSLLFLQKKASTFSEACEFVRQLPYRRNANKKDLTTVFADNCGTCSTKHALLKLLAAENKAGGVKLILGLFKMNGNNTPAVSATLQNNGLEYIPEAHNYLKVDGKVLDCTRPNPADINFAGDLMLEAEIEPDQVSDFKIAFHKKFLRNWLTQNNGITLSFKELWNIREKCIEDLSR